MPKIVKNITRRNSKMYFSVKASDVTHPHKMNHSVSEEHQVHTGASDALIILLQVHLESFFKIFERWDLNENKIENRRDIYQT